MFSSTFGNDDRRLDNWLLNLFDACGGISNFWEIRRVAYDNLPVMIDDCDVV